MRKKLFIIIPCVIAVILAGVCAFVFLNGGDKSEDNPSYQSTVQSSENPSSEEISSGDTSSSESSLPNESEPEPEPEKTLSVTVPASKDITVNTPNLTIRGSGDPEFPLTVNGEEISLDSQGLFSLPVKLKEGANTFKFSHKDKTVTYTVRYKKIIIKSVYPASDITVESGDKFTVSVTALRDSTVSASFNSKKISLYVAESDEGDNLSEYVTYVGSFETPVNMNGTKSYGRINYSVSSPSGTASKSGATVYVKRFDIDKFDGGNGYPKGSVYKNVGKTYVAEVVCDSAETFSGNDTMDTSRPTNNYLPKGTVDYCSPYTRGYNTGSQTITLYTLRYGNQLYKQTQSTGTNIKVYEGTLPETNKVALSSFATEGHHTLMTLDVDWKAPFRLDLLPQAYASAGQNNANYSITSATFEYLEIVFCYAESLDFDIDLSAHPVFSRYEIQKREYDCVLRLYLKERGKFYGWSAEYNSRGQLEFRFLNPVTLIEAENEYGYSLEGVTVLIDAGHGGRDAGAAGFTSGNNEEKLNLDLAKALEKRLLELGATVIMTRTDNSNITAADRMSAIRENRPDYAISIHRNAFSSSSPNGFISYYFSPFSSEAANEVFDATKAANIYKNSAWAGVKWHYFFLCRNTECPVVLTENGFITNKNDFGIMTDKNEACAKALTDGIMNYFINNIPTA